MKITQNHLRFGGAIIGLIAVVLLVIAVCVDQIRYSETILSMIKGSDFLPAKELQVAEAMRLVAQEKGIAQENVKFENVFGFKSVKSKSDKEVSFKNFNYSDGKSDAAKEWRNRGIVWMVFCILGGIMAVLGIIGSLLMPGKEKIMGGLLMLSILFLFVAIAAMDFLSSKINYSGTMKWGPSLYMALTATFMLSFSTQFVFIKRAN